MNGSGIGILAGLIVIYVALKIIDGIVKGGQKNRSKGTGQSKNFNDRSFDFISQIFQLPNQSSIQSPLNYRKTKVPESSTAPVNQGPIHWNKTFLKTLEWKLFEDVCMEYLRIKNCEASVTCIGADGGIDIKVTDINGHVIAIAQCKAWYKKAIGVSHIRELFGVMAAEKVKHGIFLTTSEFSDEAKEFAKGKALILIDGDEFIRIVNGLREADRARIDQLIFQGDHTTPTCVSCNTKLILRTKKTGPNTGQIFWGCTNYPRCKVTMHYRRVNS